MVSDLVQVSVAVERAPYVVWGRLATFVVRERLAAFVVPIED